MSSKRVRAVTVYQGADGQNYDTVKEALQMSALHIARGNLATVFNRKATGDNFSVNTLVAALLTNPDFAKQVRDGCNAALDYQRRYGKLAPDAKTASAKG